MSRENPDTKTADFAPETNLVREFPRIPPGAAHTVTTLRGNGTVIDFRRWPVDVDLLVFCSHSSAHR